MSRKRGIKTGLVHNRLIHDCIGFPESLTLKNHTYWMALHRERIIQKAGCFSKIELSASELLTAISNYDFEMERLQSQFKGSPELLKARTIALLCSDFTWRLKHPQPLPLKLQNIKSIQLGKYCNFQFYLNMSILIQFH